MAGGSAEVDILTCIFLVERAWSFEPSISYGNLSEDLPNDPFKIDRRLIHTLFQAASWKMEECYCQYIDPGWPGDSRCGPCAKRGDERAKKIIEALDKRAAELKRAGLSKEVAGQDGFHRLLVRAFQRID